jgi:hypothetical protein
MDHGCFLLGWIYNYPQICRGVLRGNRVIPCQINVSQPDPLRIECYYEAVVPVEVFLLGFITLWTLEF